MTNSLIRRERRTNRRNLRAELRRRSAAQRLAASCRRRPRSLATVALAAGVAKEAVTGVANGLRSVAKRLGLAPAATARTRRTVAGGRARKTRSVARWTLAQVARLVGAYRPRKAEYVAATALIAAFTGVAADDKPAQPAYKLAATIAPHAAHLSTTARLNNLAAVFAGTAR
ncbi:hypothetical protein ACF1AB_16700 [Streptomyces sp. NPDC014846]|uniref:hypothetical protein n=1 Tax=Streptomyces sp. NPDC014846 TaxID=3364922 RepID=UPI0036FF2B83